MTRSRPEVFQSSVIDRAASSVALILILAGPMMPARSSRVIGAAVGDTVGSLVVGEMVGELVGELVGETVGSVLLGALVGLAVVGEDVGGRVGPELDGARVGATVVGGSVCTQTALTSRPHATVRVEPLSQTAQAAHSPIGLCRHCRG